MEPSVVGCIFKSILKFDGVYHEDINRVLRTRQTSPDFRVQKCSRVAAEEEGIIYQKLERSDINVSPYAYQF